MKKLIAILFAIVMIAVLAGCMEVHEKTTITSWTLGEDTVTERVLIDGECVKVSSYDVTEFLAKD